MKYTKKIRQLLQQRGAEKWEKEFAESASNKRVSSVTKLTESEAQQLFNSLTECTFDTIKTSIYNIAFNLGAIINKEENQLNDLRILEYAVMVFPIEFSKPLLNKTQLIQFDYLQLWVFCGDLSNILAQHLATKN